MTSASPSNADYEGISSLDVTLNITDTSDDASDDVSVKDVKDKASAIYCFTAGTIFYNALILYEWKPFFYIL